jgi:hypothetical protein
VGTVTGHAVRTENDLRCFCSRKPKLAKYGVDDKGKMYVHVKIFKQRQVYGEILVQEGTVSILCRECLRWHRIKLVHPRRAVLEEIPRPEEVALPPVLVGSKE